MDAENCKNATSAACGAAEVGSAFSSAPAVQGAIAMPNAGGIHWSGSPDDVPAAAPHFGRTEDGADTRILIACAMMEDEVRAAWEKHGRGMAIRWVDRGYHEKPEVLRVKLQEMIDSAEEAGATQVLLAIGLCGNGAVGLSTQRAMLVMPRFDDCVNLMLCTGERICRGLAQAGVMYLTRGWAHDATMIVGQREEYARKYGERRAKRLMEAMWGAYHAVSLIDNGCYDLADVQDYAQTCARALDVDVRVDPGSNTVMEKLLSGQWDDDILVCPPGRAVRQEDFEWKECDSGSVPLSHARQISREEAQ